jgi:hypothetical protein
MDLSRDPPNGLLIAQDSRNRTSESELADALSDLEARYGEPLAAFVYVTVPSTRWSRLPTLRSSL